VAQEVSQKSGLGNKAGGPDANVAHPDYDGHLGRKNQLNVDLY